MSLENQNKNQNKNPKVTITMQEGNIIELELLPDKAPNTVNNFIELANKGYYDGLIFHRVISGFMIQGGCPQGSGLGGPGYAIFGEFSSNGFENGLGHDAGVISMARSQAPNSAGSQFFITHKESSFLDGQYAAFGKVISGMDVVDKIAGCEIDANDKPKNIQQIKNITVDTFSVEYPKAIKI